MKVYGIPDEVPFPEPDYANYNTEREQKREAEHRAALVEWLKKTGYTGPHTGEIVTFPVADGYAQYMLADGPKSFLLHLPYGDAWQYRDVGFLPKKEILKRIEQRKGMASLFAKRETA